MSLHAVLQAILCGISLNYCPDPENDPSLLPYCHTPVVVWEDQSVGSIRCRYGEDMKNTPAILVFGAGTHEIRDSFFSREVGDFPMICISLDGYGCHSKDRRDE